MSRLEKAAIRSYVRTSVYRKQFSCSAFDMRGIARGNYKFPNVITNPNLLKSRWDTECIPSSTALENSLAKVDEFSGPEKSKALRLLLALKCQIVNRIISKQDAVVVELERRF